MKTELNKCVKKADGAVLTGEFRVSFADLFFPSKKTGKFGVRALFDKASDLDVLGELVESTMRAKWGNKPPARFMSPFLDGDNPECDREECKGMIYINMKGGDPEKGVLPPGVVDAAGATISSNAEFYAGCYARATVTAYAWSNQGKNGVSISVRNVQKLRDGEPLITRIAAEHDFDAVEVDGAEQRANNAGVLGLGKSGGAEDL